MHETMSDADREMLVAEARETFGEDAARELGAQLAPRSTGLPGDDGGGRATADNVITFPGKVVAVGETFQAATVRLGRERAELRGIAPKQIDAALGEDPRLTTYMLGLLGSDDAQDRTMGEVGLRRLTEGPSPDTAA